MTARRDEARIRRHAAGAVSEALGLRRTPRGPAAILAGVVVTMLALAATAMIGLFGPDGADAAGPVPSPGPSAVSTSPSPSSPFAAYADDIIVDAQTGARYVFLDGELRPIANLTSAYLILGSAHPVNATLPHATLVAGSFGPVAGIAGAPDAPPGPSAMQATGWAVCTVSGGATSIVVPGPDGGLSGGTPVGTGAIVLSVGSTDYLVTGRTRAKVDDPTAVFAALEWAAVVPIPVTAATIDALAAAPDVTVTKPPPGPPKLSRPSSGLPLCVQLGADGAAERVIVGPVLPGGAGPDRVVVPPGAGALVRAAGASTVYLLTAAGLAFPLANAAARSSLGLATAPVVTVPADVLAAVPKGPKLGRTAAIDE